MSQPTPPPAEAPAGFAGKLGSMPLVAVVGVAVLLVAGGAGVFVLLSGNSDDSGSAAPTGTRPAISTGPTGSPTTTTTTTSSDQLGAATRNPFVNQFTTTTSSTTGATTGTTPATGTTTSNPTTTTTTTTTTRRTTTTTRRTTTTTRRTTTTTRPPATTTTTTPPATTTTTTPPTTTTTTTATTGAGSLFSFESGTDGWVAQDHASDATIATETDYASDGAQGLRIGTTNPNGDWFVGALTGAPLDLSGYTALSYDVSNPAVSFARAVFLKTGDNSDVCIGGGYLQQPAGSTPTTITVPFTDLDCGSATLDLTKVHAVGVWLNGGPVDIDDVRVQ